MNKTSEIKVNDYMIEKRNGKIEPISFTKIFNRIDKAANSAHLTKLNSRQCSQSVIAGLYHGITTTALEELIVDTLLQKSCDDPDYDILASRIYITRMHRISTTRFSLNFRKLYESGLIGRKYNRFVKKHFKKLDEAINRNNDFLYKSIFALRTLEKLYLLKHASTRKIMETPQDFLMRVAIQCGYLEDVDTVIRIYKTLSEQKYTHASPTNFNACAKETHESLASCFLFTMDDSIDDIFDQLGKMAKVSKNGGGIGVDITRIRSEGGIIRGTNGISDGIVPMLKHIQTAAQYVNQSGKRKGAFAIYLEPWHADIFEFLELKLNTGGNESIRARDLFYALFVNDAFMDAVKKNKSWYLFNPDKVRKLCDTYGSTFTKLYYRYVEEKLYEKEISAISLFKKILDVQLSVGNPYLVFKDAVNLKSNLKHYASIRSSNLCVAGSTRILTEFGYMRIDEMVNDEVKIWNGQEWSEVTIRKTGERQPLKRLHFNNGLYLDCTPQHKFYIQQQNSKDAKKLEACELRRGMILEKFDIPNWIWHENDIGELNHDKNTIYNADNPPFQGNKKQIMDWLQRSFSRDMKVCTDQRTREQNMYAFLLSQLVNGQKDVQSLVYKIDDDITYGDTYCFTEPKRGRGVFNGICAGNCAEITLPTLPDEIGTCNLSSLNLRQHLIKRRTDVNIINSSNENVTELDFDFKGIKKTTRQCVRSLNHVIDNMYYKLKETENCNRRHRPLAIGIQGLADVFYSLKIPFESIEARKLNYRIFEHIYFAALEESCSLAEEKEETPISYTGSVLQEYGKLQKDLWNEYGHNITKEMLGGLPIEDPHLDWLGLREKIKTHGVYNMMLLGLMPTASTAQTMSNFESFEPAMSNLFTRNTMMGEFIVINSYLIKDLQKLGLWNEKMKNDIALKNGSVQNIKGLPIWIKNLYKTVWEIDQKTLINLACDRGRFIDHSQSLNLYFTGKNAKQQMLESYFLAWERGLKTGVYYLRSQSALNPFNLVPKTSTKSPITNVCHLESGDCCSG